MADEYLINFRVEGADAAKSAAQGVSGAVGDVGKQAEGGGGGLANITSGLVSFAAKAGLAAAAVKLVGVGLGEIAEDEAAEIHLRKVGLAADDAKKAMAALEDIELFTGDKVAAAELYGNVINGKTRELKMLGIELAENATLEQKMAVIDQVRARGLEVDAARVGTLTGEWQRFKHGFENVIGDFTAGAVEATGLSRALGWVNTNVLGLNTELPKAAVRIKEVNAFAASGSREFSNLAAKISEATRLLGLYQGALTSPEDDTESRIAKAGIDKAVSDGAITEIEGNRQRAALEFETAQRQAQEAANAAESILAQVAQEREKLSALTDEKLRGEADARAKDQGLTGKEASAASDKFFEESKGKRGEEARKLSDAENAALREKALRADRTRAAKAELEAKLSALDKQESEAERAAGQAAEDAAHKRNEDKVKEAEDLAKERGKIRDGFAKLQKELDDAENGKGGGVESSPRDSRGRRRIISPKSNNELAPLPQRNPEPPLEIIIGKADDAAGKTKQAVDATGKSLDNLAGSVGTHTAAVEAFATATVARFENLERQLSQLARRTSANVA